MELKLPIPINFEETIYEIVETKSVLTSVIADTNKVIQRGDNYKAMQTYIAGGIEKIGDVTDKTRIFDLCGMMPYKSAWLVAVRLIMQDEKDDGVEGMYPCPRCGEKKICEFNEDPELDTRDYLGDLKVDYEKTNGLIPFKLETPVIITDEDKNEEVVETIEMEFPTLNHCSQAFSKVGDRDDIRLQIAVYVQALKKVNGIEVDRKFKASFGMAIYERMNHSDLKKLVKEIDKYGLHTRISKSCNKCGKEFEVEINSANFFVSALR